VSADDEPVPKLPRGRGLKLSTAQLVRIGGTLALLVFLIVMQRPCANAVGKFVTGFGDQGSASSALPRPGNVDEPGPADAAIGSAGDYEHLRPGMTDDEMKAMIERSRAKLHAGGGSSSGSGAGSGSGAAGSGSAAGNLGSAGSAAAP
jgi:hypothetical protein